MSEKRLLLLAPAAFSLAETSRMTEIAKGVRDHPRASQAFDIHFISEGGSFERLIEELGFPITRVEPRLTEQQIARLMAIRKGSAISVPKSKDPSRKVQAAISALLKDEDAKQKAKTYAAHLRSWNGPANAAEALCQTYAVAAAGDWH